MPYTPDQIEAISRKAALEAVMEAIASPQFTEKVRDAVLTAPLPAHPELTGAAARVDYAIRDTRIQTARIQKKVAP